MVASGVWGVLRLLWEVCEHLEWGWGCGSPQEACGHVANLGWHVLTGVGMTGYKGGVSLLEEHDWV